MRTICVILLGCWGIANANPSAGDPSRLGNDIYIASERLSVTISQSDATVKGTFTFRYRGDKRESAKKTGVILFLPIWFPEESLDDPTVAAFWKVFQKDDRNQITATNTSAFEKTLGLKIAIGQHPLSVDDFAVLTTKVWKGPYNREWGSFQSIRESGFCCLVFEFSCSTDFVRRESPVSISWRQPLSRTEQDGLFFYTPILDNLPKGLPTHNTNLYAITITAAPGCSLSGRTGLKAFALGGGDSLTISPVHYERIRISVRGRASPQGGANGWQPSGSEARPGGGSG
jgi:hypothetical protein